MVDMFSSSKLVMSVRFRQCYSSYYMNSDRRDIQTIAQVLKRSASMIDSILAPHGVKMA
jgi:hypothetical protein